MLTQQIYAHNPFNNKAFCNLISVYNTHSYPPNRTIFQGDRTLMSCAIFTMEGEGIAELRNKSKVRLKKRSVFFGNISDMQSIICNCEHWHFACYWFVPIGIEVPQNTVFDLNEADIEKENTEVTEIINLLQSRQENKISRANAYFTYKLLTLTDRLFITAKSDKLLDKIIYYINTNLESDLQIKDIAARFGYCEQHIRILFKNKFHISPKQYINRVKLERICSLMLTTSPSLQELADIFNFSSVSHLINTFKKEYGCTPKQFIKNNSLNNTPHTIE